MISGGPTSIHAAVENAEDDKDGGATDLRALGVNRQDAVVGISASGRTP